MSNPTTATDAPTSEGSIDFSETVGLLWYTLFIERGPHTQKRRREDTVQRSSDTACDGGEDDAVNGNGVHAASRSLSPSSSTDVVAAAASFCQWGEVDWVLLAARVYALTRVLHTAAQVRCLIVQDIFVQRFRQRRDEMCAVLADLHARLVRSYAQREAEAVVAAASTLPVAAPSFRGSSGADGGAVAAAAAAAVAAVLPSSFPVSASSNGASVQRDGTRGGAHGHQVPVTASIHAASSLPTASTFSSAAVTREGLGVPGGQRGAAVENAGASVGDIVSASGPLGSTAHTTSRSAEGSSPMSEGIPSLRSSSFDIAGAAAASTRDTQQSVDGAMPSSAAAAVAVVEPDPLDAPWYALWRSLPTPQARVQLRRLRFHTPVSLEDFSALLEQFILVEGADDFLTPVHAATIMEFAGVRSGPYHSIVRAPLSLAEVRRHMTETHRQVARAAMTAAHSDHASHASGTQTPTTCDAEAQLLRWTASDERRILTLAELERSIWHIAANCVVFNAPESRYPRSARRFAASCVEVMTRYCEKQLAPFLAS